MKLGRLPENVLIRSIWKRIDSKRDDTRSKTEVGEYCAFLRSKTENIVLTEATCSDDCINAGRFLTDRLTNNLAIKGATPLGIMYSITVPESMPEPQFRNIIDDLNSQVSVLDVNTRVSANVTKPVITASLIGKADEVFNNHARPGDDVIVTKWVGLEGTHIVARKKEDFLKEKFPSHLVYDAINFERFMSIIPEAATAIKSGVTAMYSLGEGGVLAGLWELAGSCGVGLDIVLRDIPLKQETVEICNVFDLNPYGLLSGGSLLMTAGDGYKVVEELNRIGIEASIIGKCTDSNDKVLYNDDIKRFIEPAKQDEIYKVVG